jgi:hypothetical protein
MAPPTGGPLVQLDTCMRQVKQRSLHRPWFGRRCSGTGRLPVYKATLSRAWPCHTAPGLHQEPNHAGPSSLFSLPPFLFKQAKGSKKDKGAKKAAKAAAAAAASIADPSVAAAGPDAAAAGAGTCSTAGGDAASGGREAAQ